jgi:hypothetical protein
MNTQQGAQRNLNGREVGGIGIIRSLPVYFDMLLYHNNPAFIFRICKLMTRYDRHPVDILIEVTALNQMSHAIHNTINFSTGGLAFRCDRAFEPGSMLEIRVPFVSPPFEVEARVAWCVTRHGHFETGVEFLNTDNAFIARMVEQVCHIENYKKEVFQTEGRILSPNEAAAEWISKYASQFPGAGDTQ